MELRYKALVMDEADVECTITRISHQILEKNHGASGLRLVGIMTRGYPLALRIAKKIREIDGSDIPVGRLDITMHRDDLSSIGEPVVNHTSIPFDVEGLTVILVDDVIYTCRTARAALDAVMELGRPAKIQLFAMIDRGHAELPIKATYVGKNIPTSVCEVVSVKLAECDGETNICIFEKI